MHTYVSDMADGDDDAPDSAKEEKTLEQRIRLLASALRSVWIHAYTHICVYVYMYIGVCKAWSMHSAKKL